MNAQATARVGWAQQFLLVALRVVIGWHFLYEGYVKLTEKAWSAGAYLQQAQGPLANVFHYMANTPRLLQAVNLLNEWGLTIVGLCLILGLLTRAAGVGAILLLALYYVANPPWIAVLPRWTEGNYLFIDKNLVELVAVAVLLAFDTGRMAGLDVLLHDWRRRRAQRRALRAAAA